jgi:hypothetical protein
LVADDAAMTSQPIAASRPIGDTAPVLGWSAAMRVAAGASLRRWPWWLVALAAFLVRGGVLLLLPPLVILPTTAELASLAGPSLLGGSLDSPTPALVRLVLGATIGLLALLVATTMLGTWLEVGLADAAAQDLEVGRVRPFAAPHRIAFWSAVEVRLLAHLPTAVAVVLGVFAFVGAATAELTAPQGGGAPLILRILLRAPIASGAILVTWFVGEAVGGIALRRLAVARSIGAALRFALANLVRPTGLATLAVTTALVTLPLVALWLSAGRAFDRLWPLIVEPTDAAVLLLALVLFVATWAAGLWLLAIGLAWRSAAWTAEALRRS